MAGTLTNFRPSGVDPPKCKIHKVLYCNELKIMNKMFTRRQSSPSTGKASFFSGAGIKICSRGWQTSRLDVSVQLQRTVQFENNKVIIQCIGIISLTSICIPNDLGDVSDLVLNNLFHVHYLKNLKSNYIPGLR